MHIVNPTLARYVGGDPGREWELSASPLMPMMAAGAKRGSISAFFAQAYTLLLPETTFAGAPPVWTNATKEIEFRAGIFGRCERAGIRWEVRRLPGAESRTWPRPRLLLGHLSACRPCPRCPCTRGANRTIFAWLCAQEASSTRPLSTLTVRLCVLQVQVRPVALTS